MHSRESRGSLPACAIFGPLAPTAVTAFLRSLRLALLVGSVLLTPQLWMVHALSHTLPAQANGQPGKERQSQSDKVCEACLAFAQLDAAMPARFDWRAAAQEAPAATPMPASARTGVTVTAFQARGPPAPHC